MDTGFFYCEGKLKTGPKGPNKYTEEVVNQYAEELLKYAYEVEFPFMNKFCADRRIRKSSIWQLRSFTENEKWQEAHDIATQMLEYKLSIHGLTAKNNPAMAIFSLKHCCGWRDKLEDVNRNDDFSKEELEIFKRNGDRLQDYEKFLGVNKN